MPDFDDRVRQSRAGVVEGRVARALDASDAVRSPYCHTHLYDELESVCRTIDRDHPRHNSQHSSRPEFRILSITTPDIYSGYEYLWIQGDSTDADA